MEAEEGAHGAERKGEKRAVAMGLVFCALHAGLQAWACPAEPAPHPKSSWKLPAGGFFAFQSFILGLP